jgi:biopolymer transport protein ExbD
MAGTVYQRDRSASIQVNMAPMIDIVFLLIVFFMLVSRIASEETAKDVSLPEPDSSVAHSEMPAERVVLNLLYAGPHRSPIYRVGAVPVGNLEEVRRMLTASKDNSPKLRAVLRADRRIDYRFVRETIRQVSLADIEIIHLAAEQSL